jgi:hypothetical protein
MRGMILKERPKRKAEDKVYLVKSGTVAGKKVESRK